MIPPSELLAASRPSPEADLLSAYQSGIAPTQQTEPTLAKAILHILEHPGSLIRCKLSWHVGSVCGLPADTCARVAVAVEYFHTASLIFDDLSCMDDAEMRRGAACVHQEFGEATAMLTALAFINKAYSLLWQSTAGLPADSTLSVTQLVDDCLGADGILSGQSRDLHFGASDNTTKNILKISEGKTVTLLRLALCLPAVIAQSPHSVVTLLEKLSLARGLAYQIADDFKDVFLEQSDSGKTSNRDRTLQRPNIVAKEGVPAAAKRLSQFVEEGDALQQSLLELSTQWEFLSMLRITVGPELINTNGIPLTGKL